MKPVKYKYDELRNLALTIIPSVFSLIHVDLRIFVATLHFLSSDTSTHISEIPENNFLRVLLLCYCRLQGESVTHLA